MRLAALVPSRCRLPECIRRILPVAVILKRFFAPRCVFSFFFGFRELRGIRLNPLRAGRSRRPQKNLQWNYAFCCAGDTLLRIPEPEPFLGASSATRTLPSIRGGVSIWP